MQRRSRKERPRLPHAPLLFAHPVRVPGGTVAGAAVLEEVEADRAVWVFRALRAALARAGGTEAARTQLPAGEADRWAEELLERACAEARVAPADEPSLLAALAALVSALGRPETTPEETAWACLCVTEWALAHGAVETALAFTQAAALARPESAGLAWTTGKMLRNHGRMREAEWWLRRGVRVAVWTGDWEMVATGLNTLGNLYHARGRFTKAAALFMRSLRIARRHKLRQREGRVLHDLFVVSSEMHLADAAEEFATGACRAYGPSHPHLPKLAHDVARFWFVQGWYARSLPLLHALLAYFNLPDERLRVIASAARAAGACGQREQFDRLRFEAWALVEQVGRQATAPAVFFEVGLGAFDLSAWDHAEEAFRHALENARERGEADIAVSAEEMLARVLKRETGSTRENRVTPPRQAGLADPLASELVHLLESAAGGGGETVKVRAGGATDAVMIAPPVPLPWVSADQVPDPK